MKELIEKLENAENAIKLVGTPDWNVDLTKEEVDLLLQSLQQSEWVKVEERLPENNLIVMVSCEHGVTMATLQKFKNGSCLWWAVINIGTYEDSTNADYVTHWMPLPTPPNK